MTALAPTVESFFTDYLIAQRGASPHTIASYRDTFRLLFACIREQSGTRPSDLDFADLDAATVSGFLAVLEQTRHNTRPDPQPAARRHPLAVPPRGPAATPSTPAHRPGPGHPAAQAIPQDGRLAEPRTKPTRSWPAPDPAPGPAAATAS